MAEVRLKENYDVERKPRCDSFNLFYCGSIAGLPAMGINMSKKQNWIIIILFLILIFGFTIATLLKSDTGFSEKENRELAQKPDISPERIFNGSYTKDYEKYLTDQFVLRDAWIGLKTQVERGTFKQEINDIYFAKDGYLIEKHTGSFTTDTALRNIQALKGFMETAEQKYGSGHVKAMIVPNAVDILREKLPPFASPAEEKGYLKKVKAALSGDTYFDCESVLREHKDEEIYYRTDHHWKTLAAFYMYEAWAKEIGITPLTKDDYRIETLSKDFLGTIESKVNCRVQSDSIEAFIPKKEVPYVLNYNHSQEIRRDLYDRSFLEKKDKYAVFFGGNQPVIEANTESGSSRKLLVIKDSYAHCFVPFAFHDFSEVDMIDLRYFNESLKDYMNSRNYTDILFLYNASGFAEDPSVIKLGN